MSFITDNGDQIIMGRELAHEIIFDMLDYPTSDPAGVEEFKASYDSMVPEAGYHHADPNEDYYQGINVMAVIRRKSDGALFGFPYWTPIAKHADPYIEGNGDKFDRDWDDYVFVPVEPFTITGYKTKEN